MLRKPFIAILLVLSLVTMACGLRFNLPVDRINTSETVTQEIRVESPEGIETLDVRIDFGAGELRLSPGAEDALITGSIVYNVPDLQPIISQQDDEVILRTGDLEIQGIPDFENRRYINEWDLSLGEAPMNLRINAGAYEGDLELGGLSLEGLEIRDGASDVELSFSEPNQAEMNLLKYETGASRVRLTGLGNANFERLTFKGGAGEYTLDFSGELKRDAEVEVEAGICSLTIVVPEGTAVEVVMDGKLADVDAGREWNRSGDTYSLDGSGPVIKIRVSLGAGELNLETR